MQRRPILFVHGLVITMDGERRILEDGAVAVCQDKIAFVGPSAEALAQYPGAETVDCRGCMILPGLIDAHGHGGHSFTRYVIKETNQWMPAMTHMYQHYVTDEFWYAEGKLQALQRLKNGVTTGVCVLGSQPRCDTPGPAFNNARGYAEVGVRDIVCTGPQHTPWPHNFSRWENGKRIRESVTFDQVCESLEAVISTLNGANGGKTLAYVTPFGLVTSLNPSGPTPRDQVGKLTEHDIRQAKAMRRIADHYHTRIHTDCFGGMIHLASQDPESMLLGPDVHIQHCTALDDQEIEILKRSGASASVAPYWSDAPVEKMLNAGIRVVIGSDGPGDNCDLDMILSARMFALNYRRDAGNRRFLPYEKLLEMITIDAAAALGLDDRIGSLEPGKQADVITINYQTPRLMPLYNPVHALILGGSGSDVRDVMVAGELLMRERKTPHVDESALYTLCQAVSDDINQRIGFGPFDHRQPMLWGRNYISQKELFDLEWQRADGGHY